MAVEARPSHLQGSPEQPLAPLFSKIETVKKDDEKELIRMAQKKLWARKDFRKATRGKGFMQRGFNVELTLDNGASLRIGYSRTKYHETLAMNWKKMSPDETLKLEYEQDVFVASSLHPSLSTSNYVSKYNKIDNGLRTFHPGGSGFMELSGEATKREIKTFISYFL